MRIGVFGCGKIGQKHLNAYTKLSGIDVVATDIDASGKQIAENYGARWHPDPNDLIEAADIDAIDVCVPTPVHAGVIMKALDNAKHVFCEKPLAQNLQEGRQINEKATSAGKIVMVGYLYRFHPAMRFAKDVLRAAVIGRPYYALARLGGRGAHKLWKHRRETGGGACNEMLVHMLDLVMWYFGEVGTLENLYSDTLLPDRRVEGRLSKIDAEDIILLKLEMSTGTTVICESDLITPSYMNHLEIHGENGSLWTSILDYFPTMLYCNEPTGIYDRGHNFFRFGKVDLFEKELAHFVECVRNQEQPQDNSLADSIRIMELLEWVRKRCDLTA